MYRNSLRAYKQVSIESASPAKLLDELYERLLRFCAEAKQAIDLKDLPAKGTAISKAIEIIGGLWSTLDPTAAPELCANLERLYEYMQYRLSEANLRMDTKPIEEVEILVSTLRQAFYEASQKSGM
jgi:flagellar protein FliS